MPTVRGRNRRDSYAPPFSLTALLAGAFVALASPAAGQAIPCLDRDKAIEYLARKYQEAPVGVGITNRGHLMELFVSVDSQTWTLLVSQRNGVACAVAAGEGWRTKEWAEPVPEGMAL